MKASFVIKNCKESSLDTSVNAPLQKPQNDKVIDREVLLKFSNDYSEFPVLSNVDLNRLVSLIWDILNSEALNGDNSVPKFTALQNWDIDIILKFIHSCKLTDENILSNDVPYVLKLLNRLCIDWLSLNKLNLTEWESCLSLIDHSIEIKNAKYFSFRSRSYLYYYVLIYIRDLHANRIGCPRLYSPTPSDCVLQNKFLYGQLTVLGCKVSAFAFQCFLFSYNI